MDRRNFWQKTGTAEIKVGDEEIGFIGEISPRILTRLNIKAIVTAFNLNFEKILKLAEEELIYEPPSPILPQSETWRFWLINRIGWVTF